MKAIILTLSLLLTPLTSSQYDYSKFVGEWKSKDTKYTMIVSYDNEKFFLYNYYIEKTNTLDNNSVSAILYNVREDFVKIENKRIYTSINILKNNYNVSVVYKLIGKNKLKATFTGDYNGKIYFKKQKNNFKL